MAKDNKIAIVLEGLANEAGHVRGNDLQKELQLLLSVLTKTETRVLGEKEQTTYYRVVALRHSSPATIVLEARPLRQTYDRRADVFEALKGIVKEVKFGSLTNRIETSLLRDLRDMAAPVGKTLASVELSFDGTSVRLDSAMRKVVDRIIAPEEVFNGAMTGMLEALNIHGEANRFWIYPDVGASKVKCDFPVELRVKAIDAVGSYVRVSGTIKYKTTAPYAHEVIVKDLTVLPQDGLPTFDDLRGIVAPVPGVSSEEFVRRIRRAV